MNNWNFTGNLGKTAEIKSTQGGKTVCTFSVAVKSGYGDNEKTTWANCAIFGKRAEGRLPEFLVKGQQVAISGEAQLDEWEKDGVKNKALKVFVNTIDLVGEKKQEGQQQAPQQQGYQNQQNPTYQQAPPQQQPPQGQADNFDQDDIPFANQYKNIEFIV